MSNITTDKQNDKKTKPLLVKNTIIVHLQVVEMKVNFNGLFQKY